MNLDFICFAFYQILLSIAGTRFVHTSEGKFLVTRLVPCPRCLASKSEQDTDSKSQHLHLAEVGVMFFVPSYSIVISSMCKCLNLVVEKSETYDIFFVGQKSVEGELGLLSPKKKSPRLQRSRAGVFRESLSVVTGRRSRG